MLLVRSSRSINLCPDGKELRCEGVESTADVDLNDALGWVSFTASKGEGPSKLFHVMRKLSVE